jgi:HEAT repeat protein
MDATAALGDIGPEAKAAIPALIKALGDQDVHVRILAANTLGDIGSEANEAVPALIKAPGDPEVLVRRHTAGALSRIGPEAKEALPELERLAEKDPDQSVRQSASEALKKIRE